MIFRPLNIALLLAALLFLNSCQHKKPAQESKPKSLSINFEAALEPVKKEEKVVGLNWEKGQEVYLGTGSYPRLIGYENNVLCFYEDNGLIFLKKGDVEGREWSKPIKVAEYKDGAAITPGPLALKNGDILCFYVDSPLEDFKDHFRIMMTRSTDQGKTWGEPQKIYQAGNNFKAGCWEPSACQVMAGDIYLFFSNEFPYGDSNEQEVTMLISEDNGKNWNTSNKLFAKDTRRIGAPAAMVLDDYKGMLLVVDEAPAETTHEKNKPLMLFSTVEDRWERPLTLKNETRWDPFISTLDNGVYAGSPSISFLSTGETVLSVSYNGGDRQESTISVFIGNEEGHFFTHKSEPFDLPGEVKAHFSSIYVMLGDKVALAAATSLNGKEGIWIAFASLEKN